LPTKRPDHPAHWFLYDAAARGPKAQGNHIPSCLMEDVRLDLEEYNHLYHAYEPFAQFEPDTEEAHIELDLANPGRSNEIAALYHVGSALNKKTSRIVYIQRSGASTPTQIPILSPLYEPLQYPLFFLDGLPGWGLDSHNEGWIQQEYYCAHLLCEPRFRQFDRLGCEYMCDMFSRLEDQHLQFIRQGKKVEGQQFRDQSRDLARDLDFDLNDGEDNSTVDDTFNLPASFTGSPKYYADRTADALALSRQKGKPDLMITATCNPNWPELKEALLPGQSATEAPHITNRAFKVRQSFIYTVL
jgi:hypothetical protein